VTGLTNENTWAVIDQQATDVLATKWGALHFPVKVEGIAFRAIRFILSVSTSHTGEFWLNSIGLFGMYRQTS
jgi:hypothetical protein